MDTQSLGLFQNQVSGLAQSEKPAEISIKGRACLYGCTETPASLGLGVEMGHVKDVCVLLLSVILRILRRPKGIWQVLLSPTGIRCGGTTWKDVWDIVVLLPVKLFVSSS